MKAVLLELVKNKRALIGLIILLLFMAIALTAPVIAPHDPLEQNISQKLLGPCMEYPFGTDEYGRCVFSRVLFGARTSLLVGLIIVAITAFIGTLIGLLAGFYGGVIDNLLVCVIDTFIALPGIVLAIVIASILNPGIFSIVIALSITGWVSYARVVRSSVLEAKEKEFIQAAKALGAGNSYIIFRHIFPNVLASVIVLAMLGLGMAILIVSGFGFLGLGVQPPMPEWGYMLREGRSFMRSAPYLTIFPGLAIMLTITGSNLIGDALRDIFDPRMKQSIE